MDNPCALTFSILIPEKLLVVPWFTSPQELFR